MTALATQAPLLVYFSSVSGNTARFVEKLGMRGRAHPAPPDGCRRSSSMSRSCSSPRPTAEARAEAKRRAQSPSRSSGSSTTSATAILIRGVISAGNTNFGEHFCIAGDIISRKCRVPHLYRLEVFGTPEDVDRVSDGLERWWKLQ